MCDALSFLLDNIYIRFGTKLYRQIVGIPMGTICAPLVADLFLFCYERDFMKDLSIHPNYNLIKVILKIPRPPFWTYICLFLTALFHPKFMINVMTLILI